MQAKTQQEDGFIYSARKMFWEAPFEYANWEWGYVANTLYPSLAVLQGHEHWVYSASFSPDNKRIVTASEDGTARIWDATTGKELVVTENCGTAVWSAVFSPDGKRILTGARDRIVRIWDAETGKKLDEIKGHGAAGTFSIV
jgi:WD40 repeat protein